VTHVFVSPHPDDAALSCGGLIARLRDGGETVTIHALTTGFERPEQLDPEILPSLPVGVALTPEYVEIMDLLDRKLAGLRAYESQLGRLFGGDNPMASDVREHATRVGELGGIGPSERYWRVTTTRDRTKLGVIS
jgi:LmbE family N-acetylglucosaminyl deacetylase